VATKQHSLANIANFAQVAASHSSDSQLLSAAKKGDQAAFGQLFERHSKKIFHSTLRITRNHEDAEDALQDCFLSGLLHLNDFDGRSQLSTWLTRIAINAALMKLRRNRYSKEVPMEFVDEEGRSVPVSNSSTALSTPRTVMWNGNARSFSTTQFPHCARVFVRPSKSANCRNVRSGKRLASWASPPPLPRAASFMPGSPCAKPASRKQTRPHGASAAPPDRKTLRT
jgi:RNA polymerase sigma factor (sigma-70 family)